MSTEAISPERAREILAHGVDRTGCDSRGWEAVLTFVAEERDAREMSEEQLADFFRVLELRRLVLRELASAGLALPAASVMTATFPLDLPRKAVDDLWKAVKFGPDFLRLLVAVKFGPDFLRLMAEVAD